MTTLCATPFDTFASAFYFDSAEDFDQKINEALPVEEFEIQYIDGDNVFLFTSAGITQVSVHKWFDTLDHLDDNSDEAISIRYLLSVGYSLSDALERADDVHIYRGNISDYVFDTFAEFFEIPDGLSSYIDYDKIERNWEIEGEFIHFCSDAYIVNPHHF